ncbi:hypothetical protein [Limnohabitans sp.]|uniref:hypothetical protein n=1 Tax=Limnohabitans sp. TaxID=1907725 RepID=UPI0033406CD0
MTERKGSCGASGFEHPTKVVKKMGIEHQKNTRPGASEFKKGMRNPEINNDQLVSNLFKPGSPVKRQ